MTFVTKKTYLRPENCEKNSGCSKIFQSVFKSIRLLNSANVARFFFATESRQRRGGLRARRRTIVKNTFGKERVYFPLRKKSDRDSLRASDERKDWNKIRILGYLKENLNENSSRNKYVTCYNDNDEPCRTCCSSSIYSKDKQSRFSQLLGECECTCVSRVCVLFVAFSCMYMYVCIQCVIFRLVCD